MDSAGGVCNYRMNVFLLFCFLAAMTLISTLVRKVACPSTRFIDKVLIIGYIILGGILLF